MPGTSGASRFWRRSALAFFAASLWAQSPRVDAVVSAADNSDAALGVAPGSLITIWGRDLAGASISVNEVEAQVLYSSATQVNAVVPASMGVGSARLRAGESVRDLSIVPARFTPFTTSGWPFGPAIVQQYEGSEVRLNRLLDPAPPGATLVLWGTGLGGRERSDVSISFGLVDAKPFYAGPAPGLPGVDQINVILPSGISLNCFVPFTVTAGGAQSSVYTISTGIGRQACSMLFALGQEGLQVLDAGGIARIAAMTVQQNAAEAWLGEYDAAHLALLATYDLQPYGAALACERNGYSYNRSTRLESRLMPGSLYGLRRVSDVIPSVTGPGGCAWVFQPGSDGVLRAAAPPGCPPERWTLRNPAGTSAAGGITGFDGPSPPGTATAVAFDRRTGALAWRGNFAGRTTLDLQSSFTLPGNIFNGQTDVHQTTCRFSGESGAATVPAADLLWGLGLPSSQSVWVSQWSGGLVGGSWSGPASALYVRLLRAESVALP